VVDPKLRVGIMGSYRRGADDCGDVDVLVTRDPTEDGKTHWGKRNKKTLGFKMSREDGR
jgi:predicted nucleotidyltransferase